MARSGASGSTRKKKTKDSENDSDDECTCSCSQHSSTKDPKSPESELTTTLLALVAKITDLLEKNNSLTSELSEIKTNHKQLLQRLETLENSSGEWSRAGTQQNADVSAMTCTVADELEAREEKKLSIVVYGLAESTATEESSEETPDETESVVKLFSDGLNCNTVTAENISQVYRMGRARGPNEKPRPFKVHFKDQTSRKTVLDSSKSLGKLPEEHMYRNVFLRPDWTKLQREQDFIRRKNFKEKQQNDSQTLRASAPSFQPRNTRNGRGK